MGIRRSGMEQTMERRWHEVWREQCEAAESIRHQYGIVSAFDYVVGEKLLTFAEAAEENPEFARALPQFVFELRRMFTPEEIEENLTRARARASSAPWTQWTSTIRSWTILAPRMLRRGASSSSRSCSPLRLSGRLETGRRPATGIAGPGSPGRAGRARHLPRSGERLLRAKDLGARPSRAGHRGRTCRHGVAGRMGHCLGPSVSGASSS